MHVNKKLHLNCDRKPLYGPSRATRILPTRNPVFFYEFSRITGTRAMYVFD